MQPTMCDHASQRTQATRLVTACDALEKLQGYLAFSGITITTHGDYRTWYFAYGNSRIAEYWPAIGKAQIIGIPELQSCSSPVQVARMAIRAKTRLFKTMAAMMLGGKHE
jgi:hypothetical protein